MNRLTKTIIILLLCSFSCDLNESKHSPNKTNSPNHQDNQQDTLVNYIPKLPKTNSVDSIIIDSGFIIIEDKFTEKVSLKQEYILNGQLNLTLYRSRELSIRIESKNHTWKDTIDKKKFSDLTGDEFSNTIILFWGEKKYENNRLHINARSCLPESDSCNDYKVLLHVGTKKIEILPSKY